MEAAKRIIFVFIVLLLSVTPQVKSQTLPFDDKWEIDGAEYRVENYLGKESLYLKGGHALIKDSEFTNGVIEFKIAFGKDRGFMGAVWRVQDGNNYEEFYVRPHQSGHPDANQYTPVFNGISAWQLYYGEDYSVNVDYKFNEWNHIKIIVSGKNAEIYINNMSKPALFISDLKRKIESGKVGLECSNFAPAHFADFSYESIDNPTMIGKPKIIGTPEPNTVINWQVSNHFKEESLDKKYRLKDEDKSNLTWTKIQCETPGYINLARIQGIADGMNTVCARVIIESDKDQFKKVSFGYSDRVKVYFNDKLMYGGQNNYMSRDYRYLGTMGYFDEVFIPLKKGTNELWFAVSESFGGWGIMARFEDKNGIELK